MMMALIPFDILNCGVVKDWKHVASSEFFCDCDGKQLHLGKTHPGFFTRLARDVLP